MFGKVLLSALVVTIVLGLSAPGGAWADDASGKSRAQVMRESWTLLAYFENDLFYNTDRYYTNAVQMRLISPDLRTFSDNDVLPGSFGGVLDAVPFPGSTEAAQYNLSIGFGQQIYTPRDTDAYSLQRKDRPYAGYLYGSLALHAKRDDRLDTLELAAGIVGPSALGEQAQNEVHRFRGFDTAKGWDNQLKDEPVAMLTWSRIWRLNAGNIGRQWGWDALPRISVSAGTPFTQASLGGEVRFGWNLPPDFGSATIQPGSGIMAPAGKEEESVPETFWNRLGVYVFAGVEGTGVLHNLFLDGNTWKSSHDVDKYPCVGKFVWGVSCSYGDFTVTYAHVLRTREFYGQDKEQNFGSITVGYSF